MQPADTHDFSGIAGGPRPQLRTGRSPSKLFARDEAIGVTVQEKGKPVSAGLREAYWPQCEGHHMQEFRVTIEQWKENASLFPRKTRP